MSDPRLYYDPEVTKNVLRHVFKGSTTNEDLAEKLGCAERTVYNKVHDPKVLGFLKKEDGEYVITDKEELMGLFQLDKRDALKKRFKDLPGVEEVNDKLNGGSLSFTEVGRLVAYYTDSEAIDEDAFQSYGRVYSNWFDYLGMGDAANKTLYRNKPPGIEKKSASRKKDGLSYPRVRPEKVFDALSLIQEGAGEKSDLASYFDFSERQAAKLLSTCYTLGLAERNHGVELTNLGNRVEDAPEPEQKRLIRNALLDLKMIKLYCELSPNKPFKNKDVMRRVGEELGRDWSDSTVQTKSKRIYRWLVYSELFKEVKRGTLVPSTEVDDDEVGRLNDYV